ncbi:hypothetical protein KM043_004032 [Ampulex compressa]|nr:hypothetical protein KM043_004032 [Ampulex compressa]
MSFSPMACRRRPAALPWLLVVASANETGAPSWPKRAARGRASLSARGNRPENGKSSGLVTNGRSARGRRCERVAEGTVEGESEKEGRGTRVRIRPGHWTSPKLGSHRASWRNESRASNLFEEHPGQNFDRSVRIFANDSKSRIEPLDEEDRRIANRMYDGQLALARLERYRPDSSLAASEERASLERERRRGRVHFEEAFYPDIVAGAF